MREERVAVRPVRAERAGGDADGPDLCVSRRWHVRCTVRWPIQMTGRADPPTLPRAAGQEALNAVLRSTHAGWERVGEGAERHHLHAIPNGQIRQRNFAPLGADPHPRHRDEANPPPQGWSATANS